MQLIDATAKLTAEAEVELVYLDRLVDYYNCSSFKF